MKVVYSVMNVTGREEREVKAFPTYEDAEFYIEGLCKSDLLGTVKFYIRKTFSNEK